MSTFLRRVQRLHERLAIKENPPAILPGIENVENLLEDIDDEF